jgi:hypothetical protein
VHQRLLGRGRRDRLQPALELVAGQHVPVQDRHHGMRDAVVLLVDPAVLRVLDDPVREYVEQRTEHAGVAVPGAGQRADRIGAVGNGMGPAAVRHEPAQVALPEQPGGQPVTPAHHHLVVHQELGVVAVDHLRQRQRGERAAEDRVGAVLTQSVVQAGAQTVPEPGQEIVVHPALQPGRERRVRQRVADLRVGAGEAADELLGEVGQRTVARYRVVRGHHVLPVRRLHPSILSSVPDQSTPTSTYLSSGPPQVLVYAIGSIEPCRL